MAEDGAAPGEGGGERALMAARAAKLDALRAAGTDPYPYRFDRTASAAELATRHEGLAPEAETGEEAAVAGRIVAFRDIGKLVFAVLRDWSGDIQLLAESDRLGDAFEAFRDLDLGDWVGARGAVITTRRGELSVRVEEWTVLAKALRPPPDKWHGLQDVEARYRRRYADLAFNEDARRIMRTRVETVRSLRRSMQENGFIEVETPMLQAQPGGALARPFVTHHDALGIDMYLRIAPELYLKRLTVGGAERVFEINRNFRNEGMSPTHSPEFTMLESYQAFADYTDVMAMTEQLVAAAARHTRGGTALTYRGRDIDLAPPFARVPLLEAVADTTGVEFSMDMDRREAVTAATGLGIEVDGAWGVGKIVTEVFEQSVEDGIWDPTFVVDYPLEVSPLARAHRDHPGLAERFEFFAGGLELANGYSELVDPAEQRRRFEAQARARAEGDEEAHRVDEDYLRALEYGMPPAGGLGVGVDRLVMLLADATSVREVVLFPHMRPE